MEEDRVVETPRLRLVACDLPLVQAMLTDRAEAERLLGADFHHQWPGEDTLGFLPFQASRLKSDPGRYIWGVWVMLRKPDRPISCGHLNGAPQPASRPIVIGDLGYKGPPSADGVVDLGYGIVPEMRRLGYTFEAVKALVEWAFSHSEVTSVTADCDEGNQGSVRILEKLGMTRLGRQGGLIKWSLQRRSSVHGC